MIQPFVANNLTFHKTNKQTKKKKWTFKSSVSILRLTFKS